MLKEYSSLLQDITMNAKCYVNICENCIKINQQDNKVIYGEANGNSFLIFALLVDMSMFVYESLNFKELSSFKNRIQNSYGRKYFESLKLIRNNVHLYNKYGSYKRKADYIIDTKLNEFKMKDHDFLYQLRNDIALMYKISINKKIFLGTNYFYDHYVYEANDLSWDGNEIIKYASNTYSILSLLANRSSNVNVTKINLRNKGIHIEFFDYKSENLFKNLEVSYITAFRLILVLSELSYISILIGDVLQIRDFHNTDISWILFLGKYTAIKYDESLDSIENMIKYSKDKDVLKEILDSNSKKDYKDIRKFGQNLRNMIHFGIRDSDKNKYNLNLSLVQLYLLETNTNNMEDFINKFLLMKNNMENIENKIRSIFNLNTI
ncbi:hypothetical protein [Clostridium tyrobutyricum]|uniref:hypothetical protein n=1 Tax=Clostridium tyrobutyricum TaxID=1519 RepID=UPI00057FFF64|nr:hypothetical protein [Clostridium tyrobutyricum]